MFVKTSSAKVIGCSPKQGGRVASKRVVGSFEYEPNTDGNYLYVAARACTADVPNLNYDMLPHDELKTAYQTFVGCPMFLNHDNQDTAKARGVIIDAKYHQDGDDKWVECLCEFDEDRCPKLCSLIRSGEIDTFSMGCTCESTTCSVCGNEAEYPHQFCEHIQQKGREYQGKTAYEICNNIDFFELSAVYDPADVTATVQGIDKNAMMKAASRKTAFQLVPWVTKYKSDVIEDYLLTIFGNDAIYDFQFVPEGIEHVNGFVPVTWGHHNTNRILDEIRDGLADIGVHPIGHIDQNLTDAKYYMDYRGWGKTGQWVDLADRLEIAQALERNTTIDIDNHGAKPKFDDDEQWGYPYMRVDYRIRGHYDGNGVDASYDIKASVLVEEGRGFFQSGYETVSATLWLVDGKIDLPDVAEMIKNVINTAEGGYDFWMDVRWDDFVFADGVHGWPEGENAWLMRIADYIADTIDYDNTMDVVAQNYSDEPRAPEDVDSKGLDDICPLCGSDAYDGEACSTCGYEGTPDGFDDIDLEVDDDDDDDDEVSEDEDEFAFA